MVNYVLQLMVISFILVDVQNRNITVHSKLGLIMIDGKKVQFIAGEMHYFRIPSQYWGDRLEKMYLAGINTVSTPIEWATHEPNKGQFRFSGEANIEKFIQLAYHVGLYVIIRAGPYIDADRDFGGLPSWLLFEHQSINTTWLRTNHPVYKCYSERWLKILLNKLYPFLYENGGPIILVQIEQDYSEYGTHCDSSYIKHLKSIFLEYLGGNAHLYTTLSLNAANNWECLRTLDIMLTYKIGEWGNVRELVKKLEDNAQLTTNRIPIIITEVSLVNSTSWHDCKPLTNFRVVNQILEAVLTANISINYNIFVSGTNFGFTAGDSGDFTLGYTTAYDKSAPITVTGNPTEQYFNIRNIIGGDYNGTPIWLPQQLRYPSVKFHPFGCLLQKETKTLLALKPIESEVPLSFRQLSQKSGFVLYETKIQYRLISPVELKCEAGIGDRGYVFFNDVFIGYFNRHKFFKIVLTETRVGDRLQILVENTARLSKGFHLNADVKGIFKEIFIQKINKKIAKSLKNWTIYQYPFEDLEGLFEFARQSEPIVIRERGPMLYRAQFQLSSSIKEPQDCYLDMKYWSKGVVFVNGYNLGRYWPPAGPQIGLYVPGAYLKVYPHFNVFIILELERTPMYKNFYVHLVWTSIYAESRKARCRMQNTRALNQPEKSISGSTKISLHFFFIVIYILRLI